MDGNDPNAMLVSNKLCDGAISDGGGERHHVDVGRNNRRTISNAHSGRDDSESGIGLRKRSFFVLEGQAGSFAILLE